MLTASPPTFDGLSRLSKSINGRNENLADLLKSAGDVTKVLGQRSEQLNALLLNANDLLGVLNDRREAIVTLLANTSAVSQQLTGLVADNEQQLAPTLERLNRVVGILEKNRDNIGTMLPQPFMDYAFGFHRGVNAGQPPDNAGPRAELPIPYNGIPGGSR